MNRFTLRAALALLAAVAALAVTGVAAAVPNVSGDGSGVAPSKVHPVVTKTYVDVEVAPTGDGPATEEDCQRYENYLTSEIAALQRDMLAGDALDAETHAFAIEVLDEAAQDAGCYVVY
jgi:hypothetical protein